MDSYLPGSISNRLKAAIDTWQEWGLDLATRPLFDRELSGNTNHTFLLNLKSESDIPFSATPELDKVVLRLNTDRSYDLGINRNREYKILEQIKDYSFSNTIYFKDDDFLISKYIPGVTSDAKHLTDRHWVTLGSTIAQVHSAKCRLTGKLVMTDELNRYYGLITDPSLKSLLGSVHPTLLKLIPHSDRITLCHNDLSPENLIITDEEIKILDWEYANLGDPLFDIAVVTEGFQLTDSQLALFLQGYKVQVEDEKLHAYKLVYKYLDILWWLVRDQQITSVINSKIDILIQQVKELIN